MGFKHTLPDGWWPWRNAINQWLQQTHTDVQRLLRQNGVPPTPGVAPPGPTPWTPLPGSGGGNGGTVYEGLLAGDLAAATGSGATPGTATLTLYAVVSGTWGATGDTITVTNRSPHLWLPIGYPLQCVNVNGEYRPTTIYSPPFRGVLTSSLSAGGTASATVAGVSVTVSPALNLGTTVIASGNGIVVNFINGTFYVVEAEC